MFNFKSMAASTRISTIQHDFSGFGEPEKDANALLIDLDKGLRSTKSGEQCEAIVRFPALFDKYPFPILINSALLKLADVFRTGNNFLRLSILRVIQQCEKHLDKIFSVDEFVRRIFSVIHSNDAIARAITLRTLGGIAYVISERKNVHHCIISSLDSHDSVELEAAIFAATKFSAHSRTFSTSICSKLAAMIESLDTPVEMKLKLIPVFQYMYHEAHTAAVVRELCVKMLPNYPSCNFVIVTLTTLTKLASKTLVDIGNQIDLLLTYLQKDPRRNVKITSLNGLNMLAKEAPHIWTKESIEKLCEFAISTPYDGLKIGSLNVLTSLSKTLAAAHAETTEGSSLLVLFTQCNFHENSTIAAKSAELLSDLAAHSVGVNNGNTAIFVQEACNVLEFLIMLTSSCPTSTESLKVCLKSCVKLCKVCPSVTELFVSKIGSCIQDAATLNQKFLLAECLASLGCMHSGVLEASLSDVAQELNNVSCEDKIGQNLGVMLCNIVLQAYISSTIPQDGLQLIHKFILLTNQWISYKVARESLRYGHHQIANDLLVKCVTKVSTEHYLCWLNSLQHFAMAEAHLQELSAANSQGVVPIINRVTDLYFTGISHLKAATTAGYNLTFQTTYAKLRAETMQTHIQLLLVCASFRTNPPPAIATSLALSSGQEYHKCARGAAQLQKCADQFQYLVNQYRELYQSSFDADPNSLRNVLLLQQSCHLVVFLINSFLSKKPSSSFVDVSSFDDLSPSGIPIENRALSNEFRKLLKGARQLSQNGNAGLITFKHIDFLNTASSQLLKTPFCFPRYFFQRLQSTQIKLAISPQQKGTEPIILTVDTHVTLKVEGVIQHELSQKVFRKIQSVKLNVSTILQAKQNPGDGKFQDVPSNDMERLAEPHNDYFSQQFLLAFSTAGQYLVIIEASIVDGEGATWKTGPRSTILVRSFDDAKQRQQASGSRLGITPLV